MAATRERLESVIWHELTAMICNKITQGEFVDAVLRAVDEYAYAEIGLLTPAERRRALEEAP
jgi:hypothetical protein